MGSCTTKPKLIIRTTAKEATGSTFKTNAASPLNFSDPKIHDNDFQSISPPKIQTMQTTAVPSKNIILGNCEQVPSVSMIPQDAQIGNNQINIYNNHLENNTNNQKSVAEQSETKSQQHKSVFLQSDDPISRIVKLEEACIRLKSRLEKEKVKLQARQKPKTSSLHSLRNNNPAQFNDNDARCFSTIIKLADFVQEKSQRLWEDPNDSEILDALSSLEYAAKMLQIECLLDFQKDVALAFPPVIQNKKQLVRALSQQQPKQSLEPQMVEKSEKNVEQNKLKPYLPQQHSPLPSFLCLPPPAQEMRPQSVRSRQSSQRCFSPSHPKPEQGQEEPENDPELEKLGPETKYISKENVGVSYLSSNMNNLQNSVQQTKQFSNTMIDKLSMPPTLPKQHISSPFSSPISHLALEPPSNCVQ